MLSIKAIIYLKVAIIVWMQYSLQWDGIHLAFPSSNDKVWDILTLQNSLKSRSLFYSLTHINIDVNTFDKKEHTIKYQAIRKLSFPLAQPLVRSENQMRHLVCRMHWTLSSYLNLVWLPVLQKIYHSFNGRGLHPIELSTSKQWL